ncbi:hypothetical protein NQ318_022531 [Aromia moschata]|uniref:Uncharacterized protein n=1 Tax=Aromia moschata TaxID=1265417 RepID=A0AAV8XM76_9CUCU|nr:hypothetical protein NQ318_022531 [Aromia moschata]
MNTKISPLKQRPSFQTGLENLPWDIKVNVNYITEDQGGEDFFVQVTTWHLAGRPRLLQENEICRMPRDFPCDMPPVLSHGPAQYMLTDGNQYYLGDIVNIISALSVYTNLTYLGLQMENTLK